MAEKVGFEPTVDFHLCRFSKQHKGIPPDRGDTILYYDAIAVGNTCADLNLEQKGYSCSSFEG